jgi:hypothetical protein
MQASTKTFLNKWFTNSLKFCVKGSTNILKICILKNPKKKKNLKKGVATCGKVVGCCNVWFVTCHGAYP